ncbi:MAG TPA: glycosyltransferase [Flavisolibacter sp.]|nr:glycosyltransferase [Flavisolibacter sp.]
MTVLAIITWIIFVYLAASVGYLFFFALAGRLGKLRRYTRHEQKARIAVLIPSYKEDNVIIDTAKQALLQSYPSGQYSVTVIADSLQPATVAALRGLPVNVVEVSFEKSMKAKSLNAAFQQLPSGHYDVAMILDADNIMSEGTLEKINHAYQSGWQVIQCHRTAKNKNTSVAVLDAMSEEVNNTIFRRGHRAAGFSCTLIGSGMAFQYDLLKQIFALPEIQNNPGEDREVDIQLVKKGIVVEYIEDAFIYDEKVQRKEVFEKQRTRWLATQVDHFKRFLKKDMLAHAGKKTYMNKLFQNILLPRLLFMLLFCAVLFVCAIDALVAPALLSPAWPWWTGLFLLYLLTMLTAIPGSFYNKTTFNALLEVPALVVSMLKALLKIKQNKRGFIHTPKEFSR